MVEMLLFRQNLVQAKKSEYIQGNLLSTKTTTPGKAFHEIREG